MYRNIQLVVLLFLLYSAGYCQQERSSILSGMTLSSAGTISVTIGGAFIVNGTFAALPNERVDQFVTRIFIEAKDKITANEKNPNNKIIRSEKELKGLFDSYARRNILLKRYNGEESQVDLEKFRFTGDFKNNPYLRNDDVLIFPSLDMDRNYVSIGGAVNNPVKIQFVEDDRFSTALLFAGGINKAYENVDKIIIYRLSYDGSKMEKLPFNISDDPLLRRGDHIDVVANETMRKEYTVVVNGEVNRPGEIQVTPNNTTLREVIDLAGGFRGSADLSRAEIIRGANVFKSVVFTEELENSMMLRMAEISAEDSSYFVIDNKLRFSRGNGAIDFARIYDSSSQAAKFIVKPGDYVHIPEKINLVYIFGQVNEPGYVPYVEGQDVNYYISKAGGKGLMSKDEIYIIDGKTRSWIKVNEDESIVIKPGDYVWIPRKQIRTFGYYLQRVTAISSIIGSIATVVLLITQF
ncbi:MAG: SLBB domain-containing protein [Clostridiales bacterium]